MAPPDISETESAYQKFRVNPNDEFIGEEDEPDRVFMTMTDRDGSILYEMEGLPLLHEIVQQNGLGALQQYFTIAPCFVPKLPNGEDEIIETTDYFRLAVESGSLDVLQWLLNNAPSDTVSTQPIRFKMRGFQLLNEAARYGHIEMVKLLLDHQPLYANIQDRDTKGYTAILSAADVFSERYCFQPEWNEVCLENNEAVINLLLDQGAYASDTVLATYNEETLDTVLTLAVKWAGPELIKRLIDCGANFHTTIKKWTKFIGASASGVNALAVACYHANFKAAETLIDCRGVVTAASMACSRDSLGGLPLHWATGNQLPDNLECIPKSMLRERVQNITSLIELLLDLHPAAINIQDQDGYTPLHHATESFGRNSKLYTPVFELLCKRGSDASIRNNKGQTPLHTLFDTCITNVPIDPAAISVLLAHGARVTDTVAGNTPLHIAAGNLHFVDAVSCLLDHGADPTAKNLSQATALHRAASGRSWPSEVGKAEARTRLQEDMLARLAKAGGEELMDLPDMHNESPRQICQRRREEWRNAELPCKPSKQLRFSSGRSRPGRGRGQPRYRRA
ncbi:ankyrin repeat-containing domain protein [Fusarium flagelliforme]|uniref:ankyrin repeat-containing domain protein n=1 Tax=Fusarium flagelliforme TaxID=2675880 RepID=UPI001E8D0830|nr:ankyrin repeat-containing domain protein [Fusarium flagelliforme]KAH7183619.1 ankyrin repeat-containing domain protein [Fusarium flagelliforme]